jgi:hypothetical protein
MKRILKAYRGKHQCNIPSVYKVGEAEAKAMVDHERLRDAAVDKAQAE